MKKLKWLFIAVIIAIITGSNRVWLSQRICLGHGLCTNIGRTIKLPWAEEETPPRTPRVRGERRGFSPENRD